jgi:hypothetical protein
VSGGVGRDLGTMGLPTILAEEFDCPILKGCLGGPGTSNYQLEMIGMEVPS